MKQLSKEVIAESFRNLQLEICSSLENLDGRGKFYEDIWERPEGGGGFTRVIKDGNIIAKGGVNFSAVEGSVSDFMKQQTGINADSFFACGVSIVLHPHHPFIPIIHMNVRYFETNDGAYWLGGGIDLTPHYIDPLLAREFHLGLKSVCDKYNPEFYTRFKNWADDYFFLPHRNETRGVGGIFFDHLNEDCGLSKHELFNLCIDLGKIFPELYKKQVESGINKPFTTENRIWQNLRRGRYVEFNLVHDRGTKFGLVTGGRTESILMSLPPLAEWEYDFIPSEGSPEAKTQELLRKGIDWIYC